MIKLKTKKKLNNFEKVLYILISIVLLMCYASIYFLQYRYIVIYTTAFVMVIMFLYVLVKHKFMLAMESVYYICIYFLFVFMHLVYSGDSIAFCYWYMVIFPSLYFFAMYLYSERKMIDFFTILVITILAIAIISMFFWIFGSNMNLIKYTNSFIDSDWGINRKIYSYYGIYYEIQHVDAGIWGFQFGYRNCAIFAEGPVASFIFCLGLILNINYTKIYPKAINGILTLTILSTFSKTGLIVILLCILQKAVLIYKNRRTPIITRTFLIFISTIFVIFILYIVYSIVINKLGTRSGIVRGNMIISEFKAFMASPLMGHGVNTYTSGSSNSFFALLADGGIYLWGLYYIPLFICFFKRLIMKKEIDWFILIYLSMFIITVVHYTAIAIFIASVFWQPLILKRRGKYDFGVCNSASIQCSRLHK